MPVLEGPGEERPGRGDELELLPVIAEADDHCARVHAAKRLQQDVDALVVQELAEVDDGRLVRGEEFLEARRVAVVRLPLACVRRVGRVGTRFLQQPRE